MLFCPLKYDIVYFKIYSAIANTQNLTTVAQLLKPLTRIYWPGMPNHKHLLMYTFYKLLQMVIYVRHIFKKLKACVCCLLNTATEKDTQLSSRIHMWNHL